MTRRLLSGIGAALIPLAVACSGEVAGPSADAPESVVAESVVGGVRIPIANFAQVNGRIYRGGHPDARGLDYLKSIGVRTIIDLEVSDFIEAYPWDIDAEVEGAASRGLALVREPMSAFEPALSSRFDARIDSIIARLGDASQGPFYVHCLHGQDRTGLVIGLERVLIENWEAKRAHDEMVTRGFHTAFIGLDEYFDRKTGWEDE